MPEDLTIKDVENFKSDVGLSVDTMSAILQQFKTELAAEKSARCQLAEELERTKADEARAKERMTTMEAKMKKFDEPSCDQTKALAEKAHQNEDRVAALQAQLDSLGLETGKQSASLDQSRKEQPSLSAKDMVCYAMVPHCSSEA